MPNKVEIRKTEDGSCTLYMPALDETYHSCHGAIAESVHVYIRNGLERMASIASLTILEIGFGTGLNALLTLDNIPKGQKIRYYAVEPYPIATEMILEYYAQFDSRPQSYSSIVKLLGSNTGILTEINDQFSFCFLNKDLKSLDVQDLDGQLANLVYYDAFGPSKQPEMWTQEAIGKVAAMMCDQAILCTYCAQGQFKRNLKSSGFSVENPEGALGKRQMTVATRHL
jgi:tRNA U34 5-methylaminomethyl-2-thiouridine-forming methyltransferase MnmC